MHVKKKEFHLERQDIDEQRKDTINFLGIVDISSPHSIQITALERFFVIHSCNLTRDELFVTLRSVPFHTLTINITPMNSIKQYLIGKKKDTENIEVPQGESIGEYRFTHSLKYEGRNELIEELLSDLPQLEKELIEEIGDDERYERLDIEESIEKEKYLRRVNMNKMTINSERSRFRTIIHNFFN